MKKIKNLSKEEKFRIKGLDSFVINADGITLEEYNKMTKKIIGPQSNQQIEDYGHMFRAGFLKCLELTMIKLRDS